MSILYFIHISITLAVLRSKTRRRVCGLGAGVGRPARIVKCNEVKDTWDSGITSNIYIYMCVCIYNYIYNYIYICVGVCALILGLIKHVYLSRTFYIFELTSFDILCLCSLENVAFVAKALAQVSHISMALAQGMARLSDSAHQIQTTEPSTESITIIDHHRSS